MTVSFGDVCAGLGAVGTVMMGWGSIQQKQRAEHAEKVARMAEHERDASNVRLTKAGLPVPMMGVRPDAPGYVPHMELLVVLLLLILLFGGFGFAVHALWIVALVLLVVFVVRLVMSGAGSRR